MSGECWVVRQGWVWWLGAWCEERGGGERGVEGERDRWSNGDGGGRMKEVERMLDGARMVKDEGKGGLSARQRGCARGQKTAWPAGCGCSGSLDVHWGVVSTLLQDPSE